MVADNIARICCKVPTIDYLGRNEFETKRFREGWLEENRDAPESFSP